MQLSISGKTIQDFAAEACAKALGGGLHFTQLAGEVAGGARDGHDADGGAVPDQGFIQFGDGDVEAVAKLFLERAHDLAAVLEGLCVLDAKFEGQRS